MGDYRLYVLDKSSRIIGAGIDITADNDDIALLVAASPQFGGEAIEVWSGRRHVGIIAAGGGDD